MTQPSPFRRRQWMPALVFAVTLLSTIAIAAYVWHAAEENHRLRFEKSIQDITLRISNRIETYVALLRSAAALYAASDAVEAGEFRLFVDRLELRERYPGIQGIGFSIYVDAGERAALARKMRDVGHEGFRIWPEEPSRPFYTSIIHLEPLDRRNRAAIGYDMFAEPVRREAMLRAAVTGLPAATGRVTLVQEIDVDKQAGFLIYFPVYRDAGAFLSHEEWGDHLRGFVYSPFRAGDLLAGVLDGASYDGIAFTIYDGQEPAAAQMLHDSEQGLPVAEGQRSARFSARRVVEAAPGRTWTVLFEARPEFVHGVGSVLVPAILACGMVIGMVLFTVTRSEVRARSAAEWTAANLRASEQALRDSESRLRRLVDANIIGIMIGRFDGTMIEANDAFLEIVGFGREELEAGKMDWRALTAPEDRHLDEEALAELRKAGRHEPFEKVCIKGNGERVPVLAGNAYLGGAEERLVGFFLDLTERKRAEEERERLLARERHALSEARAAGRAKDEFLATLSHELRTPLNAILGWTRLITLGSMDAERQSRAMEIIEKNARAQAKLIDDLLDVSRIITGRMTVRLQEIDLNPVLQSAVEAVMPAASAKGVDLRWAPNAEVGDIMGDADRLQQIVWNLLSNAIKFTPAGGRVELRLARRETNVEISVRDTGDGIDADFAPHLFERFRQADSSTTRTHGGMGLGLAIARHLTELHGGTIRAQSDGTGQGSTFVVALPARPAAAFHRLVGLRALVAAGDPAVRRPIELGLSACGADVWLAGSAEEALATMEARSIDVFVSDLGPWTGADGPLPQQAGTPPWSKQRRIAAIALASDSEADVAERARSAGFDLVLTHPVDYEGLLEAVVRLVQRGNEETASEA
jgi:PAS domain S-box-containing protein